MFPVWARAIRGSGRCDSLLFHYALPFSILYWNRRICLFSLFYSQCTTNPSCAVQWGHHYCITFASGHGLAQSGWNAQSGASAFHDIREHHSDNNDSRHKRQRPLPPRERIEKILWLNNQEIDQATDSETDCKQHQGSKAAHLEHHHRRHPHACNRDDHQRRPRQPWLRRHTRQVFLHGSAFGAASQGNQCNSKDDERNRAGDNSQVIPKTQGGFKGGRIHAIAGNPCFVSRIQQLLK